MLKREPFASAPMRWPLRLRCRRRAVATRASRAQSVQRPARQRAAVASRGRRSSARRSLEPFEARAAPAAATATSAVARTRDDDLVGLVPQAARHRTGSAAARVIAQRVPRGRVGGVSQRRIGARQPRGQTRQALAASSPSRASSGSSAPPAGAGIARIAIGRVVDEGPAARRGRRHESRLGDAEQAAATGQARAASTRARMPREPGEPDAARPCGTAPSRPDRRSVWAVTRWEAPIVAA